MHHSTVGYQRSKNILLVLSSPLKETAGLGLGGWAHSEKKFNSWSDIWRDDQW